MSLKVIGAGFGRTGTLSLKLALEQLGFAPCYHMIEVFSSAGQAETWEAIARGAPIDWHRFLERYEAAVDWPACHFWRELMDVYPDAKVLLTARDEEAWYDSMSKTILEVLSRPAPEDPMRAAQHRMARLIVLEQTFSGKLDKDNVLAAYRAHNAAVRAAVPPERLVVYDVAEGWEPLCRALGVAVPAAPFPRTNSSEEFRSRAAL